MTRSDRSIRVLLVVIAFLLGGNLFVQINATASPRTAMAADAPDNSAKIQAIVDQLVDLNKKADKLQAYLESGSLTVKSGVR